MCFIQPCSPTNKHGIAGDFFFLFSWIDTLSVPLSGPQEKRLSLVKNDLEEKTWAYTLIFVLSKFKLITKCFFSLLDL